MSTLPDIPEMEDDQFWSLISLAKQDFAAFTQKLEQMSQADLISFVWKFEEVAGVLYDDQYLQGQTSEDYIEDLRGYVVAQGKAFYEHVRDNPDQMPKEVDYSEPGVDIKYQASETYYNRFGESMPPL